MIIQNLENFASRYASNYEFYYDNEDAPSVREELRQNCRLFDCDKRANRLQATREFVNFRGGDYLSSDRECGAFYKTCNEFGIL